MAQKYSSSNPLKDALTKLTVDNIKRMDKLRVAKSFANIGYPFVGFEGKDKSGRYFQLRVDYDDEKKGHVNLMINGSERHEYMGQTYDWYCQVLNNINGGQYCGTARDDKNNWLTHGQEENAQHIEGMKKYMLRSL